MDLKENRILESGVDEHWYYISKSSALLKTLSHLTFKTIFDIGAGDGFFTKKIINVFTDVTEGWCIDSNYTSNSSSIVNGKKINYVMSPPDKKADLLLFMDVLEHVNDDALFLDYYIKFATEGAYFFFSVPAFPFLWSGHDRFLDHKRRYTLKGFEELIKKSGLSIITCNFYYGVIFPIAATLRIASKFFNPKDASQLKKHTPLVNNFLLAISLAEYPVSRFNRLFGLSIFCLARKP